MKLFTSTVQFKPLDLGDSGFSLGDEIVFADDLLRAQGGTGEFRGAQDELALKFLTPTETNCRCRTVIGRS